MISSLKTEQKAIHKINDLIINIPTAYSKIDENDKNISWDGTIDFYENENIEKKDNYLFSIDVQVKGRSTPKKRLGEKQQLDMDIADIRNYLKKDGTLLLLVMFRNESEDYKIYFLDLLPYNITKLLANTNESTKTVKVKLKELKGAKHLEKICHNFNKNKEIQKKMDFSCIDEKNLNINNISTIKMSVWENDLKNFRPENLVGTYQYIYKYNENNIPISVDYSMIYNISHKVGAIVQSADKEIKYDDIEFLKTINDELIIIGKSFTIDMINHKFNINLRGTIEERIKSIKFSISLLKNNYFLINDDEFKVDNIERVKERNIKIFNDLLEKYYELKDLLKKHNINEDIDLDKWDEKDIDEFNIWMDAIENNKELSLKSDNSIIGSKKFGTIKISIMATMTDNKKFKIENIWNNNMENKYRFKYSNGTTEYHSNNIFLNLIAEAYESDDINFDEMKKSIDKLELTEDECVLINLQVLNVLDAYDKTNNKELLDYAEYLILKLLEKKEDYDIYYINYCQILKRKGELSEKEQEILVSIKENSERKDVKLSCCLLLDSKLESKLLINKMCKEDLEEYKKYPISIYLKNNE